MHARPPLRPAGARSRPHARSSLAAVFGVLALTAGCDGRDAPADPRPAPTASSAQDGPLALYRLATLRAPDGESRRSKPSRPAASCSRWCRAPATTGAIGATSIRATPSASSSASSPTRTRDRLDRRGSPPGQGRRVGYRLHYGFAEGDLATSLVRVQAAVPRRGSGPPRRRRPSRRSPSRRGGVALATQPSRTSPPPWGWRWCPGPCPRSRAPRPARRPSISSSSPSGSASPPADAAPGAPRAPPAPAPPAAATSPPA
jgi:hypothetical protein